MPTQTSPSASRHFRFSVGHAFTVNATSGNLENLQLMAAGREAKGHGIYIDERTLETAKEAVDARGGRLKAYVTHNHAGPCSYSWNEMDEAGSELNIPGFFSEIAVKSAQLIAGQFEFFEAFKRNFAPQYEQLVEMAKKTPDLLGISLEVWGYSVYVGKDGTEYSGEPSDVELLYNGMPALRVTEIWGAAFVADGAATDGLFAKLSVKLGRLFGAKQERSERHAIAEALLEFARQYGADGSPLGTELPNPALSVPTATPTDSNLSATMKLFADLKAKITDPTRFAAAMSIVGNTPADKLATLSVGEVEQQLLAVDFSAATTKITALTADLAARDATIVTLTTDRDAWKQKFEALKASGKPAAVDLGATTAGVTADEPNPYAKETRNLSRQAELSRTDPERAKALKAAATAAKK